MMSPDVRPNVVLYTGDYSKTGKLTAYSRTINLAGEIASIRGSKFGGEYARSGLRPDSCYFVPIYPLLREEAARLEICDSEHLFGGVVPVAYMTAKGVTHGIVNENSVKPEGWNNEFSVVTSSGVLPGLTAFSEEDAFAATGKLIQSGFTPRAKRAGATNGDDQTVIRTENDLKRALEVITDKELRRYGLVLEANMDEETVRTASVGQVQIAGILITYYGKQRSIEDSDGSKHYGGTDMFIVRGDFPDLLKYIKGIDRAEKAVEQAAYFDQNAKTMLGVFGSRRNYDVVQGYSSGNFYSGVTDPSWRLGGASAAEVLAIQAFKEDPNLNIVMGSTKIAFYNFDETRAYRSSYGKTHETGLFRHLGIPQDAFVTFNGYDPKYHDSQVCYATIQRLYDVSDLASLTYLSRGASEIGLVEINSIFA